MGPSRSSHLLSVVKFFTFPGRAEKLTSQKGPPTYWIHSSFSFWPSSLFLAETYECEIESSTVKPNRSLIFYCWFFFTSNCISFRYHRHSEHHTLWHGVLKKSSDWLSPRQRSTEHVMSMIMMSATEWLQSGELWVVLSCPWRCVVKKVTFLECTTCTKMRAASFTQ